LHLFSLSGFSLFKTFFENVNLCDHRLKRQGTQLVSVLASSFLYTSCGILGMGGGETRILSSYLVWSCLY